MGATHGVCVSSRKLANVPPPLPEQKQNSLPLHLPTLSITAGSLHSRYRVHVSIMLPAGRHQQHTHMHTHVRTDVQLRKRHGERAMAEVQELSERRRPPLTHTL